jgi:hypothetical protein
MNLNGSGRRLVLQAEPTTKRGNRVGHLSVKISPDGTKLAYVRQMESGTNGSNLSDRLWVADLATGRKTDLGPAPSSDAAVAWMDNSTLLAESPNGNILQRVSIAGGGRATYLVVSNSRIARAYERARPGAGPPVGIEPVGWSTDPNRSALAVLLWGVSQRHPTKAVIALIEGNRVIGFAPDSRPLVTLTWGPAERSWSNPRSETGQTSAAACTPGSSDARRCPAYRNPYRSPAVRVSLLLTQEEQ